MIYRFDEFELDLDRYQLLRANERIALEPLQLEFLAYLIEHRDRVVSKAELVEQVWQEKIVGDSVLSRAAYTVRQALGDDSRAPRYLETIHGRGFRFVASLEDGSASERKIEPFSGELRSRPDVSISTSRRSIGLGTLAISLLAFAGGLLFMYRSITYRVGDADNTPASVRLALVPAASHPEIEANFDLVAVSIVDLISARLREVEGLIVRSPELVRQHSLEAESLAQLATDLGVSHLVTSSIKPGPTDAAARIELELVEFGQREAARRTPLGRFTLPRIESSDDLRSFLDTREAIADKVLVNLGFAPPIIEVETLEPTDAEAYRLYLIANQRLLDGFCDDGGGVTLLERSLELDPQFVPAWVLLAVAYYNQVWACGGDGSGFERAARAAERAAELAPTSVEPQTLLATLLVETGRVEEAFELVERHTARHPSHPDLLAARLYALRYAGFLDQAIVDLELVLELDPLYLDADAAGASPNSYLYLGRLERFLELLPHSDSAYHRFYRGFAEFLSKHPDEARAALEPAFRSEPGGVFGRLSQALLAILDEDFDGATVIVEQLARQRRELGAVDGEITFKQAQFLALLGHDQRALAELTSAVEQGFSCSRCLETDPLLDTLREDPRFLRALASARHRHRAFSSRFGLPEEHSP